MTHILCTRSNRFLIGLLSASFCFTLSAPANSQSTVEWVVDPVPIQVGNSTLCVAELFALRLERYATPIPGKGLAAETLITLPFNLGSINDFAQETSPTNEDMQNLMKTNVRNGFGLDFTQFIATEIQTEHDTFQFDWFFSSDSRLRMSTEPTHGIIVTKVNDYFLDEIAKQGHLNISYLSADPDSHDKWTMPSSLGETSEVLSALAALRACSGV